MLYGFNSRFPTISDGVFVAPEASIIGDVIVGRNTSVWFGCVLRGDVNYIRVGENCNLQDGTIVHVTGETHPCLIEDECTIAHRVMLHGCVVRRGAFIGMSATILDGSEIGEMAFIAAGSLVTPGKKIPPRSLVMGSPAKIVREISAEEEHVMKRTISRYGMLRERYLEQFSDAAG
jgi:carbonic anhydrase/acetyltransferase-like protein (isoleucine patch superfamily)